jgi:hypothetical protein
MHGLTSGPGTAHSFVRSATLLAACIFIAALLMIPIALRQTGSGSPVGLAIAAGICLVSGLLSESIAFWLVRSTPLGATLIGMIVRMVLPLGVCVAVVATGQSGRQNLAFIAYLMLFYFVTLVLETCFGVKRASSHSTALRQNPR